MFEFFRNLYWKNKRMVFECETMEELEEHYITRFENANNESIGSTQTETFVSNNQDTVKQAFEVATCLARTRWSNVNRAAINLMIAIDKDPLLKEEVINDINNASLILQKRISLFDKESKEVGLDIYPVSGGFFACVNCEDGHALAERLKNDKIYVLPFSKVIRVALCSIPCDEIKGLAKRIKDCL